MNHTEYPMLRAKSEWFTKDYLQVQDIEHISRIITFIWIIWSISPLSIYNKPVMIHA